MRPSPRQFALGTCALLLAGSGLQAQVGGGYDRLYRYDGFADGQATGSSVAIAGDVDGDGFDDFIIGASGTDNGPLVNAGSASVYSGADGSLIHSWIGREERAYFGDTVAGAGDLDNDGFADVIIGAPYADPYDSGVVYAFSGATGNRMFRWSGHDFLHLGFSVSGGADVDGDGFDDVVLGGPYPSPLGPGHAQVYSGADGSILHDWLGAYDADDSFGSSVAMAGDLDGDGFADVLVGAPNAANGSRANAGSVTAFSGATGAILYTLSGQQAGDQLGWSVSGAGDLNGDGFADFLVGAPTAETGGVDSTGVAAAFSGADGSELFRFEGTQENEHLGAAVADAGDVDGDGFEDILLGSAYRTFGGPRIPSSAYLYSGKDGSLLFRRQGWTYHEVYGSTIAGGGDVNGDGRSDLVVGAEGTDIGPLDFAGSVFVYSYSPYMTADITEISATAGGTVTVDLDFRSAAAGFPYQLLFSRSGTGPAFYGVAIPLTVDNLTLASFLGIYPFPISTGLTGTLDAAGNASADFTFTPGFAAGAVGTTLHYAAITKMPSSAPVASSVAGSLEILP